MKLKRSRRRVVIPIIVGSSPIVHPKGKVAELVYCGTLLRCCTLVSTIGSNPILSAIMGM